jgi:hypothetical protein
VSKIIALAHYQTVLAEAREAANLAAIEAANAQDAEPSPEVCEHVWEWVRDWFGDPNVINGTCDCSGWRCKKCDSTDCQEPPDDYYEKENDDD